MRQLVRAGVLAIVLVFALAACGGGPAAGPAGPDATDGADAMDFTTRTVDGQEFSGRSLAGDPAVMWFWSPWCAICQREAPAVAQAAQANPAVSFVGVAGQDQVDAMRQFVAERGVGGFPHLADVDGEVWRGFGVTSQPSFAFVGADGRVDVVEGAMSGDELAGRVAALG